MEQKTKKIAHCRGCDADILWLKSERTGKPSPIDAYPAWNGNVLIDWEHETWRVATTDEKAAHGRELHLSHFATCPFQEKFRTRGRK